jgi:hypothetical protein
MNPVPPNIEQENHGCSSIMSSNCIAWVGALPDCISTCTGDNLTQVIQAIANVACDAFDTSQYNTTNINEIIVNNGGTVTEGEDFTAVIKNIQESINVTNIRIDELTAQIEECCELAVSNELPEISTCLVSQKLPLAKSVIASFEVACEEFAVIKELIAVNDKRIADINYRIDNNYKIIDKKIADLAVTVGEIDACTRVTVGSHLLTGPTLGQSVCAGPAVEYMANIVSSKFDLIGTEVKINEALAQQNVDLYAEASIADPSKTMSEIGLLNSPTNMADSIKNLWTTVQDIREGFIACCGSNAIPCVLIPPGNLRIENTTSTTAEIQWNPHGLPGAEPEIDWDLEVFAYDGTQAVGPALLSQPNIVGKGVYNLTTNTLDPAQDYVVRVTASYNCGIASSEVVGKLLNCEETIFTDLELIGGNVTDACDGVNYVKVVGVALIITLKNSGGQVINNTTGSDITVQVRVPVEAGNIAGVIWENYDIVVPNNGNQGVISIGDLAYKVLIDDTCYDYKRAINLTSGDTIEFVDHPNCNIGEGDITVNIAGGGGGFA